MILIILPVKNEEMSVITTALTLFEWCKENLKEYQIVFIDDGSTDKTIRHVEGIKNPKIKIIKNQFDRGKGSALKVGFVLSAITYKLKNDDLVIFMDGDGQIEPKEIKSLFNRMNLDEADVVIGNKYHAYSITEYGFFRMFVSFFYNMMVKCLFGLKYDDTQCGIKIFKKYALDEVVEVLNVKTFAFDLELIVALREMGMRVVDAPVRIKKQLNKGSVSLISIYHIFIDTILIWIRKKRGCYHESHICSSVR